VASGIPPTNAAAAGASLAASFAGALPFFFGFGGASPAASLAAAPFAYSAVASAVLTAYASLSEGASKS